MRLVEIIRGKATSDETIARAYDYVVALGKTPIVVNDSRGFFTSRVFGTYVMEGAAMLADGIPAPLIEHAALAAGMPVGPLAVLDETSLALSVHVIEQTRADLAAEGRTVALSAGEKLVERMVKELGRTGRAGGGGFYDYPQGRAKQLWPGLREHFERSDVEGDIDALKQRLLYRQSIETARCLAEGVLTSTAEANIGSIYGIGFPAWTGGAMQFIASEGRERFLANADALAARCGDRFALADERARGDPRLAGHGHFLSDRIQVTSCFASASLTCGLAGIGTAPQTPEPPFITLVVSLATASAWPAYLAATSL